MYKRPQKGDLEIARCRKRHCTRMAIEKKKRSQIFLYLSTPYAATSSIIFEKQTSHVVFSNFTIFNTYCILNFFIYAIYIIAFSAHCYCVNAKTIIPEHCSILFLSLGSAQNHDILEGQFARTYNYTFVLDNQVYN